MTVKAPKPPPFWDHGQLGSEMRRAFQGLDSLGEAGVRARLHAGILVGQHRRDAENWLRILEAHRARQADADKAAARDMERRSVEAAESSATAARRATWIALAALVVSIAGAALSVASYFRDAPARAETGTETPKFFPNGPAAAGEDGAK